VINRSRIQCPHVEGLYVILCYNIYIYNGLGPKKREELLPQTYFLNSLSWDHKVPTKKHGFKMDFDPHPTHPENPTHNP
jgi:hypothetical protein